jgi:hypothetical protein
MSSVLVVACGRLPWGVTNKQPLIATCCWDTLCQSRVAGGLSCIRMPPSKQCKQPAAMISSYKGSHDVLYQLAAGQTQAVCRGHSYKQRPCPLCHTYQLCLHVHTESSTPQGLTW